MAAAVAKNKITLRRTSSGLGVWIEGEATNDHMEALKTTFGALWNTSRKAWVIPAKRTSALLAYFATIPSIRVDNRLNEPKVIVVAPPRPPKKRVLIEISDDEEEAKVVETVWYRKKNKAL